MRLNSNLASHNTVLKAHKQFEMKKKKKNNENIKCKYSNNDKCTIACNAMIERNSHFRRCSTFIIIIIVCWFADKNAPSFYMRYI